MGGLASLGGALASAMGQGPDIPGLPKLPADLGLPQKVNLKNRYEGRDFKGRHEKADAYNKSLAELLNNQPQLNYQQRSEIYGLYSDSYAGGKRNFNAPGVGRLDLTDYGSTLSQASPEQYQQQQAAAQQQQAAEQAAAQQSQQQAAQQQAAQQQQALITQQQQQAAAQRAAQQAQQAAQKPQTVGPVAKPPQPEPTPVVATPGGNIAGSTKSTVSSAPDEAAGSSGRKPGRRGRFATLLTGLGGALESFGN